MRKSIAIARTLESLIFPAALIVITLSATLLAEELATEVKGGLRLAVGAIIPALFPFMILADIISSIEPTKSRGSPRLLERAFGIGSTSARAFIIGCIAGAPITAAMLSRSLDEGIISEKEAERTLAISSSPSLAFAVSGVGAAMWRDVGIGVALYLSVIAASVIYGIITRGCCHKAAEKSAPPMHFDLMASIEKATFSSLRIVGVVTAFSVISGMVRRLFAMEIAPLVIPLLEVGNAASYLSECALPQSVTLPLTAFALGFSGISVHLQVRGAIGGKMRYSQFLFAKFLIGLVSAAIFSLIWLFIK